MNDQNTIRNYKNAIFIYFAERGDNFTLKVPHHNKWLSTIRFLKNRGWEIKENPSFKKHFSCLSKYHKIGYKNNVALLMEIGADNIKVEFGDIKNLWTGVAQSFWSDPSDSRFTKLTYLESIAVKLEIHRLLEYYKRYNHEFTPEDSSLSPENYIINKLKNNTHIHGVVNCLNDIKVSMSKPENHNYIRNSSDKDGKRIICGEEKYFYNPYTKRLSYGVVWHNINNMWWVISGGKLFNICASDLFDFSKSLSRREPVTQSKINTLIDYYTQKREYIKCDRIYKSYEKYNKSEIQLRP